MIVHVVTYRSLPRKDALGWLKRAASEVRDLAGLAKVKFVQSYSDPNEYGGIA